MGTVNILVHVDTFESPLDPEVKLVRCPTSRGCGAVHTCILCEHLIHLRVANGDDGREITISCGFVPASQSTLMEHGVEDPGRPGPGGVP